MKYLESIKLAQFFLFEKENIQLKEISGIFGPNGSGKSSFLDAVQIAMFGANRNLVSLNAQADESKTTRSIRGYCLGQYGESPEHRARDNATTYISLIWRDSETNEPVSMGVCIYASGDREGHEVLGRYLLRGVELSMSDHLEMIDGKERPREWATFKHQLIEKSKISGEHPLFSDAKSYIQAILLALRGSGGAPAYDAFTRAFRFALRMRFDKTVDEIVRNDVLEARPTNVRKFKEVTESFRRLAEMVAQVEKKIIDGEVVEKDFARAAEESTREVTWSSLGKDVALEQANESVNDASQKRFAAEESLEKVQEEYEKENAAMCHARAEAKRYSRLREQHSAHAEHGMLQSSISKETTTAATHVDELKKTVKFVRQTLKSASQSPLLKSESDSLSAITKPLETLTDQMDDLSRETLSNCLRPALKLASVAFTSLFKIRGQAVHDLAAAKQELKDAESASGRASQDKAPLSPHVQRLLTELRDQGLSPIPVCDLVTISEREWQPVIESYLGPNLEALLVAEHEEKRAFEIYRELSGPRAIYGAKIVMESRQKVERSFERGTVAELIKGVHPAAVAYLQRMFGDTRRAHTNAEALVGQRTLTSDGMLIGKGEMDRLRPVPAGKLRIGAGGAEHREDLKQNELKWKKEVSRLETLQQDVDTLAKSLTLIGEFEVMKRAIDTFDQMNEARDKVISLTQRLMGAADQEYVQLGEQELSWEQSAGEIETRANTLLTQIGGAETTLEQCKGAQIEAIRRSEQAQLKANEARSAKEYNAEYAAKQWDAMLEKHESRYGDMARHCEEQRKKALERRDASARAGTGRLGTFLATYREQGSTEMLSDWKKSHGWISEILQRLRNTELLDFKEQMDAAYRTSQETFRNDVAIALSNNLDWLDQTMARLNKTLAECPVFTNGERYQFRRVARETFNPLLKFIKDIAARGPVDDLFEGAGPLPEQFKQLLEEKTMPGASGIKSPLDDYREFFQFDIEIQRVDPITKSTKIVGHLSKRIGPGSGGEHRAPLYVIAGAALASAYRLDKDNKDGLGLILLDEAFNKMDVTNIVATMRYLEDLGLQVFMASPGENLGTLTAFLHRYFDIMRDAEHNVVIVEGHNVAEETRAMFREDLPEFNPALVEQEIAQSIAARLANSSSIPVEEIS
jgi:ABC-type Mn2+/Zn2+ transport system ATPase subunit